MEKSGWLTKKGEKGIGNQYKKRFFSLKEGKLYYGDKVFSNNASATLQSESKGAIELNGYRIEPSGKKKFAFDLVQDGARTWHLAAESQPVMNDWIETLTVAINELREGSSRRDSVMTAEPAAAAAAFVDISELETLVPRLKLIKVAEKVKANMFDNRLLKKSVVAEEFTLFLTASFLHVMNAMTATPIRSLPLEDCFLRPLGEMEFEVTSSGAKSQYDVLQEDGNSVMEINGAKVKWNAQASDYHGIKGGFTVCMYDTSELKDGKMVYSLGAEQGELRFTTYRTLEDFRILNTNLRRKFPQFVFPTMPPLNALESDGTAVGSGHIQYIKKFLRSYIYEIMNNEAVVNSNLVKDFVASKYVMCEVAAQGNVTMLETCITQGTYDVNATRPDGQTALHIAASLADHAVALRMTSVLLTAGANIKAMDMKGRTVLSNAALAANVFLMRELIGREPSLSKIADAEGESPVHQAAAGGDVALRCLVEEFNEDYTTRDNSNSTPFHDACDAGQTKAMIFLLSKGIDVNDLGQNRATGLILAAANGHTSAVSLLLQTPGINVNARDANGRSALHVATENKHLVVIVQLLTANIDSTLTNNSKLPALHVAVRRGDLESAAVLLHMNCDPNIPEEERGDAPIHVAAARGLEDLVSVLLENGADASRTQRNMLTPLHVAVIAGKAEVAMLLVKRGANINAQDENGCIPLYHAVAKKEDELALDLARYGGSLTIRNKLDHTALSIAVPELRIQLKDEGAKARVPRSEPPSPAVERVIAATYINNLKAEATSVARSTAMLMGAPVQALPTVAPTTAAPAAASTPTAAANGAATPTAAAATANGTDASRAPAASVSTPTEKRKSWFPFGNKDDDTKSRSPTTTTSPDAAAGAAPGTPNSSRNNSVAVAAGVGVLAVGAGAGAAVVASGATNGSTKTAPAAAASNKTAPAAKPAGKASPGVKMKEAPQVKIEAIEPVVTKHKHDAALMATATRAINGGSSAAGLMNLLRANNRSMSVTKGKAEDGSAAAVEPMSGLRARLNPGSILYQSDASGSLASLLKTINPTVTAQYDEQRKLLRASVGEDVFTNRTWKVGVLAKQGEKVTLWKNRLCVLKGDFMSYYVGKPLPPSASSDFALSKYTVGADNSDKFCFALRAGDKRELFKADSDETVRAWMAAINAAQPREDEELSTTIFSADKEGPIKFKGGLLPLIFRDCYLVLRGKHLYVFGSPPIEDFYEKKGEIPIRNCTAERTVAKNKYNCFKVTSVNRTYLFAAPNDYEVETWLNSISAAQSDTSHPSVQVDEAAQAEQQAARQKRLEAKIKKVIPPGQPQEFTVQVILHEGRDFKGRDKSGQSDPVVTITVFNEKKKSKLYKKTLSPVFTDPPFVFKTTLEQHEFDSGVVVVSVSDDNTFSRNTLIGSSAVGLSDTYEREGHEFFRQWVGLADTTGANTGLQGYVRLSIAVVGPGDVMPVHTENTQDDTGSGSLQDMVLLPPDVTVEEYCLSLNLYLAQDLPRMDKLGKCDGFVVVKCGNNAPIKTRIIKRTLNPQWDQCIQLPVGVPALSDLVLLELYDYNVVGKNELIGRARLSLKQLIEVGVPLGWRNLYGAPTTMAHDGTETAYRGRMLLSGNCRPRAGVQPSVTSVTGAPPPTNTEYTVWVDVFELSEIPVPLVKKIVVEVCVGSNVAETEAISHKGGYASAYARVPEMKCQLSPEPEQLPDAFINVYAKSITGGKTRVGYLRFPAAELLRGDGTPFSEELNFSPEFDDQGSFQLAGFLLFSVRMFSRRDAAQMRRLPLEKPRTSSYELRCYLYQGTDLPAADDNGLSDPYCIVTCSGASATSKIIYKTLNPRWYQTLCLPVEMPDNRLLAPDIQVTVMDKDTFGKDDLLGRFAVPACDITTQWPGAPIWREMRLDTDGETKGRILVSFQLIPEGQRNSNPPRDITPEFRDCVVFVDVIGARDLISYQAPLPIYNALVEIDCGNQNEAVSTRTSDRPSWSNPNFIESLRLDLRLPVDPLFAPALNLRVRDSLAKGVVKPLIGNASLSVADFLPWVAGNTPRAGAAEIPAARGKTPSRKGKEEDFGEEMDSMARAPTTAEGARGDAIIDIDDDFDDLPDLADDEELSVDSGDADSDDSEEADEGTGLLSRFKAKIRNYQSTRKGKKKNLDTDAEGFEVTADGRRIYKDELEDTFTEPPFSVCNLTRGKATSGGGTLLRKKATHFNADEGSVGVLKLAVSISDAASQRPNADIDSRYPTGTCIVRVYALRGHNLASKDLNGFSDPYLKLVLAGREVVDDVKNHANKTLNPLFYKCYEFQAVLPGEGSLSIECWDWDAVGKNDLIGRTQVDLEQRYFCREWREFYNKRKLPIEYRSLYGDESALPQGKLEVYIDILSADDAVRYPADECAPPPPEPYQLRVAVFGAKEVPPKNALADGQVPKSDIFVTGEVFGDPSTRQKTDTHWNSENGTGTFNWRLVYNIMLPCDLPRFKLQLWDAELVNSNNFIGEVNMNLGQFFEDAHRRKSSKKLKKQWLALTHPNHAGNQGQVSLSFQVMPEEEAENDPVGLGRDEPNHSPFLAPPDRPETSYNPLRLDKQIRYKGFPALKGFMWQYKKRIAIVMMIPTIFLIIKVLSALGIIKF